MTKDGRDFRVTRRDVEVLEDLRLSTVIGIGQLVDLGYFRGISRARRRLAALESRGYVRRTFYSEGYQSARSVFALGLAAADLLSEALGYGRPGIARQASRPIRRMLLEHSLDVVRARLALTRRTEGLQVQFLQEPLVRHEFRTGEGGSQTDHVFKPDGLFRVRAGGRSSACFLELDRGSCSLTKWSAVVDSYATYVRLGLFGSEYGSDIPAVLAVATAGPERIARMSRIASASGGMPFWFSTLAQVENEGCGGRIWTRTPSCQPRSLVEIAQTGEAC